MKERKEEYEAKRGGKNRKGRKRGMNGNEGVNKLLIQTALFVFSSCPGGCWTVGFVSLFHVEQFHNYHTFINNKHAEYRC